MKLLVAAILVTSAAAFQTSTKGPVTASPEEAPTSARKGAANELEGVTSVEDGAMSLGKYEGGSLPFKLNKITTYVNRKEVVLVQSKQRFAIPVKAITEVSYGSAVPSRVGATTGSAVMATTARNQAAANLTIAGIVWTVEGRKNGVVLRIDKGDFPAFLSAIQTVTGLNAVNADAKDR